MSLSLATAAALLFGSIYAGSVFGQTQSDAPIAVIGATVGTSIWQDPVEALGTLKADESVTLSSTLTGTVSAINFEDGDSVEARQWLVQLDDEQAQAELRAAQALLDQRRSALDRAQQLQDRNLGVRATLEDNAALVRQSEAEIDAIRARLADHRLRAPFAGTVGLRDVSVGALVTPGTELVTLDKLDTMKLDFTVPATLLSVLHPGLTLSATTPSYPDATFRAEVATLGTRIDPVSRSLVVRANLDNPDGRLLPGMLMEVRLNQPAREALTIPESALVPDGERQTVWLIEPGQPASVTRREVAIGERRQGEVEITDGLESGQRIVTHGTLKVREGDPVELIAEDVSDGDIKEVLERQRRATESQINESQVNESRARN
ncbi:efflux RND transporter periplasmic adaptor subunit [Salinicola sp. MIT1003]|uniref:efflux RND transporter periplasmic adaptor subunit n=1 Tax=Salinicola sp. MIT1003 TaxID=1882734 RepID=UPI0008DC5E21|nr:efflux RND transporter periplasmic adaptor subunit [Salinicola sp. MIT1003]OHY97843.1 efflux transporter periplasmic adaptor subunit [Salinicola sp. MIT1003]